MLAPTPAVLSRVAAKAELYLAGIAFVIMLGVIVLNVFLRYLFSNSVLSAEEVAYMGFTWSTFAAVAYLYRTRALIAVDVFFMALPRALQRFFSIAVDLSMIVANLWFCWLAWVLASGGWIRKTPVLEIPYFWINLAPLLAFGLMAIYSAVHLVQSLKHHGPYDHDPDHDAKMSRDSAV